MKKWCEHILRGPLSWWYSGATLADDWNFCPICGKPKPSARKGKGERS